MPQARPSRHLLDLMYSVAINKLVCKQKTLMEGAMRIDFAQRTTGCLDQDPAKKFLNLSPFYLYIIYFLVFIFMLYVVFENM